MEYGQLNSSGKRNTHSIYNVPTYIFHRRAKELKKLVNKMIRRTNFFLL